MIKNNLSNIYNSTKNKKYKALLDKVKILNKHHFNKSAEYNKIVKSLYPNFVIIKKLEKLPMLPVRLFKSLELKSIENKNIYKIMHSSGTSRSGLSKIYLDKENAKKQIEVLNKIFSSSITSQRLPMLVISKKPEHDKDAFNAQTAAILGFSLFSKKNFYLLDKKNNIDLKELKIFKEYVKNKPFFIFGFTSKVYENLILKFNFQDKFFKDSILIHGGGWKKLEDIKISNREFKKILYKKLKIKNIYNYYGLIEQTGSIFIESPICGYFHTTTYSDIIIRDENFNVLKKNQKGLIQLISSIPTSYPGHNILTEDLGEIIGEDDCKCGLKGKYFKVYGRIEKAEIRGCSNFT